MNFGFWEKKGGGVETLVPIFGAIVGGYHKSIVMRFGKSHQRLLVKPVKSRSPHELYSGVNKTEN